MLQLRFANQEIRNPSLVNIKSAHPHRIATYDERGEQTTGDAVVLVLVEFCAGGSLEDYLKVVAQSGDTECKKGATAISPGRELRHGGRDLLPEGEQMKSDIHHHGLMGKVDMAQSTCALARRVEVCVRQV